MTKPKPTQDGSQVTLPLVRGAPDERVSITLFFQTIAFALVHLFFVLPARLFLEYIVLRPISPVVKELGRPPLAHAIVRQVYACYDKWTPGQIRLMLDRKRSYNRVHSAREFRGWVERVEVNGTAGRWLAPPKSDRKDDDVVIYFVHGGGFIFDSGTNAQVFFLETIKQLKKQHGLNASVFFLDYRLAPEYKYPSQLIETLAGYHYLVNTVGIPEDKIVLGGDSAGANLASAFLLHLARPSPAITVPEELGETPKRPAGALLISPYTNLYGATNSFYANTTFDILSPSLLARAAFAYIGAEFPSEHKLVKHGWNPLYQLFPTQKLLPQPAHRLADVYGWSDVKNIKLFQDPYVNPFVNEDSSWWTEACPGDGKTLVSWGGKELFVDDDEALFRQLEKAGVEPVKVFHPLKLHDWLLHDYGLPLSHQVKRLGNEIDDLKYGLNQTVKFIAHVVGSAPAPQQPRLEGQSSATKADVQPTREGFRSRSNNAVKADYSNDALATAVGGLKAAERQEVTQADYSDDVIISTVVGLRRAEQQNGSATAADASASKASADPILSTADANSSGDSSPETEPETAKPSVSGDVTPTTGGKNKKKKKKANKSKGAKVQPASNAPGENASAGSYAAVASHHDHIAPDAPVVAEGEGAVIHAASEAPARETAGASVPPPTKKPAEQDAPEPSAAVAKPVAAKPAKKPTFELSELPTREPASSKPSEPKSTKPAPSSTVSGAVGSYAAVAAHDEHIAQDAPVVAHGEGDVIHRGES